MIRLHSVATRTKAAGGHDKLAAATAEQLKRGKDKDYVNKLGEYSNGRLLDMLSAAERAHTGAAAGAASKPAKSAARAARVAATAKPVAKKAAPVVKKSTGKSAKGKAKK